MTKYSPTYPKKSDHNEIASDDRGCYSVVLRKVGMYNTLDRTDVLINLLLNITFCAYLVYWSTSEVFRLLKPIICLKFETRIKQKINIIVLKVTYKVYLSQLQELCTGAMRDVWKHLIGHCKSQEKAKIIRYLHTYTDKNR